MPNTRTLAAVAAAAVTLTMTLSPASARSCDDGNEPCVAAVSQTSPMKLDHFMKTWKPVASSSKRAKKHGKAKVAPEPARQTSEPAAVETAAPSELPAAPTKVAAKPEMTIETDGVGITSFNDVNELDAAADQVQVVAFNEVNEIDLAAPAAPPASSSETTGQSMVSADVFPDQTPADTSWIGKLLLAFAGTIAVAGMTRLLVA
jgi:hypothetical protein